MRLALVLDARAPLCACERKPALDRIGVDGRVFRRWPMRGWGPDGRKMLTLIRPAATGSRRAKAHNEVVRGVAYEREDELLESFSRAARGLLEDGSLAEALDGLAEAAAAATGSDLVIVRTIAPDEGCLVARAVRAESSALAAELEGSRLSLDGLDAEELESSTSSSDEGLPGRDPQRRLAGAGGDDGGPPRPGRRADRRDPGALPHQRHALRRARAHARSSRGGAHRNCRPARRSGPERAGGQRAGAPAGAPRRSTRRRCGRGRDGGAGRSPRPRSPPGRSAQPSGASRPTRRLRSSHGTGSTAKLPITARERRTSGPRSPTVSGRSSRGARRAATDRAPAWRRSRSESLRSARCSSTSTPSRTRTRSRSSCRSRRARRSRSGGAAGSA